MRMVLRLLGALAALVLVLVAVLYGASEWTIRRGHAAPLVDIAIPHDAASIAEGARLARITGCRGCHNANGEGSVWSDPPWFVATIAPPGIARKAAGYTDAELVRLIRHGVRKDGTALFIMPAAAHRFLADDDVGRIVAWIRSLKPGPKDVTRATDFGPVGRWMIVTGQVPSGFQLGNFSTAHRPADVGNYYYHAVCSECHKLDKPQPTEDGSAVAPALAPTVASYDPAAFHMLLKTGVPMSGAKLGLMGEVARADLSALTDQEVDAIQAYLKGEAEKEMSP